MKIVIVGAGGRLGAALQRLYSNEHKVIGFGHAQLDLGKPEVLQRTLSALDFNVLINSAAQTNVDRCETHPKEAFELNAEAPRVLAEICTRKCAKLIHISTDYVFSGDNAAAYFEDDPAEPISVYGASKLEGERRVLTGGPQHLVVRVSWIFGPDRPSFVDWVIGQAREREHVEAVADKTSTPTYTVDLAKMLQPLLGDGTASGIVHLTNDGDCSWREYGQWALECCAEAGIPLKTRELGAISLSEMKNFIARRPVHTVLATDKYERLSGKKPRHWREAVAEYVREHVRSRNR